MQRLFSFCFAGLFSIVISQNNSANAQTNSVGTEVAYNQLIALLIQKEYFRLEVQLKLLKGNIKTEEQLYFQSYVDNAFNRNVQTIKDVDTLLEYYSSKISDSLKGRLYLLKDDSYFKLFQYSKAELCDSMILHNYAGTFDTNEIKDIKNRFIVRDGLQTTPPQQTTIKNSATIHWRKDKIGLIEIPIRRHLKTYNAVFDTRANLSCISQTYAAKLNLNILPVYYDEGSSITGIQFKTGLAIADSLYMGNILVRNAVFLVLPDSILNVAPGFSINIIIGFPIIEELNEVHIYKDGRMTIPLKSSKSALHNFALDGLDPIISLKTATDTLCFHFDLGASQSVLYYNYFAKYKEMILKEGTKKTSEFGGAGGMKQKELYTLPALHLYLNDKKVTLDKVDVLTEKNYPKEKFYGNLGQDFTRDFNELILNFRDMYIQGR